MFSFLNTLNIFITRYVYNTIYLYIINEKENRSTLSIQLVGIQHYLTYYLISVKTKMVTIKTSRFNKLL